jgi:cytochrome c-type biogenesis protein CcmH/NrfG
MYILLVVVFAGGFVLFGVGSGSTGIGDVLQNFFNQNKSTSKSAGALRDKVREHPKDAQAWHDLGTKLSQDQKTGEAIQALKRYVALRPNDESGLQELAGLYARRADDYQREAAVAQAQAQLIAPDTTFRPPATTPIGRLYQAPDALQDQISAAVTESANEKVTAAYQKLASVSKQAVGVYRRLIKLDPTDATRQIQLGEAAQNAGDAKTAVAAYKRFLKLAPDDPLAPAVKQQLQQLQAPSPTATASG